MAFKKILLEDDAVSASRVTGGQFPDNGYDFPGAFSVDTINEHTEGEGVSVDFVELKDRTVAVDAVIVNPPGEPTASEGVVRLPNGEWIKARNAADTADIDLIRVNSSDRIELGAAVEALNVGPVSGGAAGEVILTGAIRHRIGSGGYFFDSISEDIGRLQFRNSSSASGGNDSRLYLLRTRGSADSPEAVITNDSFGRFVFYGHDGAQYAQGAQILVEAAEDFGPPAHGGRMRFHVVPTGSTTQAELLRLDGRWGGRVNILGDAYDKNSRGLLAHRDGPNRFVQTGKASLGSRSAGTYVDTITLLDSFGSTSFVVMARASEYEVGTPGGATFTTFESIPYAANQFKVRWSHSYGASLPVYVHYIAVGN